MKRYSIKKQTALLLRTQGKSIPGIAKELDVAKSTVSLWVRDVELPKKFKKRLKQNSRDGQEKGREMIR